MIPPHGPSHFWRWLFVIALGLSGAVLAVPSIIAVGICSDGPLSDCPHVLFPLIYTAIPFVIVLMARFVVSIGLRRNARSATEPGGSA